MVYDDAEKLYAEVRQDGENLLQEASEVLLPKALPLTASNVAKVSGNIVGFNTTFFSRRDIVEVPLTSASAHLRSQVVQTSKDGTKGYALLDCSAGGHLARPVGFFADCMPVSGACYCPSSVELVLTPMLVVFTNGSDHFVLRNSSIQVTISKGRITSLFDVNLGCAYTALVAPC